MLYQNKPVIFNLGIDELKQIEHFRTLLNRRTSGSQGGSAESAGLTQLIEWKEALENGLDNAHIDENQNKIKKTTVL